MMTRNDLTLQTYSQRMSHIPRSCVRDLMAASSRPDTISFAGGVPAPECIPLDTIRTAADRLWSKQGSAAMSYGASEGEATLREWIAQFWLPRHGIKAHPSEILIVNGSQQALDLLGKVMLDPGAPVAIERPTYLAALQAFSAYEPVFREVPLLGDGPDLEILASALRGPSSTRFEGAKLFYSVPNFQNPSGILMPATRRAEVAAELNRHAALLVEDDPYGELYYSSAPPPRPLNACGVEQGVLLGTFSKMVAPGFRLGFIWAKGPLAQHLGTVKQGADLCTSKFSQMLLTETLELLDLDSHLVSLRAHYRNLRDHMQAALTRHLANEAQWDLPAGGMFFWLRFPQSISTRDLLARCATRGVVFADGSSFHADGGGTSWARLNFTAVTPTQMELGLTVLAEELARMKNQPS